MLGKQVVALVWSVDQRSVASTIRVVFNVSDQSALVQCVIVHDPVAHEVFGGFNRKGADGYEQRKHAEGQPLMLGFLFEEPSPTTSHGRGWGGSNMKTLLGQGHNAPPKAWTKGAEIS